MFKINIKKLLGPLSILTALGMALAFTPKKADNRSNSPKKITEAWIKINCASQEPEYSENGNTADASEAFPFGCAGTGNICAVKLDLSDPDQAIPAEGQAPGNYMPVVNIHTLPENQVVRCNE